MFQETDAQQSLGGPEAWLPESKRNRLEQSWAGTFRESIVPLIDEEKFASLYHETEGAPCKSVRAKICLLLFRELFDLTDAQTLQQYEWNLQWHYAMGVRPEDAHLTRKSLYNFRQKLMDSDKPREFFEQIVEGLVEEADLEVGRQRQDSTRVLSNIRKMTRLELFVETIESFLQEMQRETPEAYENLPEQWRERYGEADGAFSDVEASRTRRTLEECAQDLGEMLEYVDGEELPVEEFEHWEHLCRLFEEQCRPAEAAESDQDGESGGESDASDGSGGGGAGGAGIGDVEVRPADEIASDSMQSPHDPTLEYHGRYGVCHLLQLVETTSSDNAFEVVVDVEVEGGSSSDQNAMVPALERLGSRGLAPGELLVDMGYTRGTNLVEAARRGTDVIGPVKEGSQRKEQLVGREEFVFGGREESPVPTVERCPEGHQSVGEDWTKTDKGRYLHTRFDRQTCEECPRRRQCPVMRPELKRDEREGRDRHNRTTNPSLRLSAAKLMVARQRQRQSEEKFEQTYRYRAACEATNSELKRAHGLSDLTIRGRARIEMDCYFKAAAMNIKRFLQAVQAGGIDSDGEQTQPARLFWALLAAIFAVVWPWRTNSRLNRPRRFVPSAAACR